jgi:GNAT superfamily N-acetyltransferase
MRDARHVARRSDIAFLPLTRERWPDLERLFGPNGACAGCWCMWWRLSGPEFRRTVAADRRKAFKACCGADLPPGLIAYRASVPVGWVAVAPRAGYRRLAEARVLKPVDDRPVWSITCFFVHRSARRAGLMVGLIEAAVAFAAAQGAELVEAYPKHADAKRASGELFVGAVSTFARSGFKVVAQPSAARSIMRREVRKTTRGKTKAAARR